MADIWLRQCKELVKDPCTGNDGEVGQNVAFIKSDYLPKSFVRNVIRSWDDTKNLVFANDPDSPGLTINAFGRYFFSFKIILVCAQ